MNAAPTFATCDAPPLHVVLGSEWHEYECGCGWRSPRCADARTARQAHIAHREGRP